MQLNKKIIQMLGPETIRTLGLHGRRSFPKIVEAMLSEGKLETTHIKMSQTVRALMNRLNISDKKLLMNSLKASGVKISRKGAILANHIEVFYIKITDNLFAIASFTKYVPEKTIIEKQKIESGKVVYFVENGIKKQQHVPITSEKEVPKKIFVEPQARAFIFEKNHPEILIPVKGENILIHEYIKEFIRLGSAFKKLGFKDIKALHILHKPIILSQQYYACDQDRLIIFNKKTTVKEMLALLKRQKLNGKLGPLGIFGGQL